MAKEQWEYHQENGERTLSGYREEIPMEDLNKLGKQGWEIISADYNNYSQIISALFKRKLSPVIKPKK